MSHDQHFMSDSRWSLLKLLRCYVEVHRSAQTGAATSYLFFALSDKETDSPTNKPGMASALNWMFSPKSISESNYIGHEVKISY